MGFQGITGFGGGATGLSQVSEAGLTASGGTKVSTGSYHYHVFLYPNSDTFSVSGAGSVTCTYLVAAGGGGGGSSALGANNTANVGAGGGAGYIGAGLSLIHI